MAVVYIGIGSNLGDKKANCLRSLKKLSAAGVVIRKESALYETMPWGLEEQPGFMNMTAEAETGLPPEKLLGVLKEIEREMGREESVRWGPRLIDLDLLFYDDKIIESETLTVPHRHLHERKFVLLPLSEIAPDLIHPVFKRSIKELKEILDNGKDHIREQQVKD